VPPSVLAQSRYHGALDPMEGDCRNLHPRQEESHEQSGLAVFRNRRLDHLGHSLCGDLSWTTLDGLGAGCWIGAPSCCLAERRGPDDPNYVGYGLGFFKADKGLEVTLLSASLLAFAMAGALIAGTNRPGKPMLVVTGTSSLFGWNTLFWLAAWFIQDPTQVKIQLGEMLTIEPAAAVPLLLMLFVVPFAFGARWSWRRAFE
jgi:hypothetical protein